MREVLYVCEECDNEFWVPEEKAKELIISNSPANSEVEFPGKLQRCVDCLEWSAQAFILGV